MEFLPKFVSFTQLLFTLSRHEIIFRTFHRLHKTNDHWKSSTSHSFAKLPNILKTSNKLSAQKRTSALSGSHVITKLFQIQWTGFMKNWVQMYVHKRFLKPSCNLKTKTNWSFAKQPFSSIVTNTKTWDKFSKYSPLQAEKSKNPENLTLFLQFRQSKASTCLMSAKLVVHIALPIFILQTLQCFINVKTTFDKMFFTSLHNNWFTCLVKNWIQPYVKCTFNDHVWYLNTGRWNKGTITPQNIS